MNYILNSAVITGEGTYRYKLITKDEAVNWLKQNTWESRVGYPVTAEHIYEISGIKPVLSRETTKMEVGDTALVVRLKYRVQKPEEKKLQEPDPEDWEYGILEKIE